MAFRRTFTPELDGDYDEVPNPGGSAKLAVHFEVGDYATPFWVQIENGPVHRVDSLPFRLIVEDPDA